MQWTGTCIGKRNYRYFYMFIWSIFLGVVFILLGSIQLLTGWIAAWPTDCYALRAAVAIISLGWSIFVLFSVGTLLLLHTYLVVVGKTTYEFLNERNDREKKRKALAMALKANISDKDNESILGEPNPETATPGASTRPYLSACSVEIGGNTCSGDGATFHRISESISHTSEPCIKQCITSPSMFTGATTTSSSVGSFTETVTSHLDPITIKLRECFYLLLPEVVLIVTIPNNIYYLHYEI